MALSEREVVDCLTANFKQAAEHCDDLARLPKKGPTYAKLRQNLKLIEGASRQLAYMRDNDARWLKIGLMMAETHEKAGEWLRGMKQPGGGRRPIPPGTLHPLFVMLAQNLRQGHAAAERLRTAKTGRVGAILPIVQSAPHRDTRPVGWTPRASGLLIPTAA